VGPPSSALASGLAVGVRVDVSLGPRTLAVGVPVSGLRLEWTSKRVVPALLSYEAPLLWAPGSPEDPLARFGQRSHVTVVCEAPDGRRWETPLGMFVHSSWSVGDRGVTVQAHDLMRVLEDDPMAWPSSPESGATVRSEAQRLAGTVPVVLDPGVDDGPVSVSTQWTLSRTESLSKLAESRSAGVRAGVDGCLHLYPLRDASSPDVVFTPATGLLDAPPAPGRDDRTPNRWVVTGTHREGETEEKWTAVRENRVPPFDPDSYGWVTRHEEFSAASSREAVEKAAETYMRQDLSAVVSRSIEVAADPRIEVGDVIGVVPASEPAFAGRVVAYTLPVSEVGASMRIDLDVLEW